MAFHWQVGALFLTALVAAEGFPAGAADEPPPAQGTRLHFQKTLHITPTGRGRIFAETHPVAEGETLKNILSKEYGIPEGAQAPLAEAFRAINPGVDPKRLPVGEIVQIPFKVEEQVAEAAQPVPGAPPTHTVRPGESLWRILKNQYKVPREAMKDALAAVARANPDIRDLNHIVPGQKIAIPEELAPSKSEPVRKQLPAATVSLLDLLRQLNCQVLDQGETPISLARGRSVRLDGRDFPIVTGPSGRRIILDPQARLSPALVRSVEEGWGVNVIREKDPSPEAQLERILPRLGFHELSRDERTATIGRDVELVLRPRWTVVPRPKDLWEGQVHLLFAQGAKLDPAVAALARKVGFALHVMGATPAPPGGGGEPLAAVPELAAADLAQGAALLLGRLQIDSRVRGDVDLDLGGGVRYRIQPELTFTYGGASYAVAPREPPRAEAILAKAGYLTLSWQTGASPLGWIADLLSLIGRRTVYKAVEAPAGQAIALRVDGLLVQDEALAASLYPALPTTGGPPPQVLLTEAELTPQSAAVFLQQGLRPWVVRAR